MHIVRIRVDQYTEAFTPVSGTTDYYLMTLMIRQGIKPDGPVIGQKLSGVYVRIITS